MLALLAKEGVLHKGGEEILEADIQPASIDLHLGDVAYSLRSGFLPSRVSVAEKLARFQIDRIDLGGEGAILERYRPYLIPLLEYVDLPPHLRGKANPKSSTGRLDILTRVITDRSFMYDEVPPGYHGRLYLELVSSTFPIQVKKGLALNQLRISAGRPQLNDENIQEILKDTPLLFENGHPSNRTQVANGLFLSLDLGRRGGDRVGFRAKDDSPPIDLSKFEHYKPITHWETVSSERGGILVLHPGKFYLLLSKESVRIPPEYAAEMTAYDPTSGELRTHYAGFFDPGFGFGPSGQSQGSKAALEVRAHDVPFAVEHGQNICRLTFEHMLEPPKKLYSTVIGSHYQKQESALSKHFIRQRPVDSVDDEPPKPETLF